MRISDWSSDVCSSDLHTAIGACEHQVEHHVPDRPRYFGGAEMAAANTPDLDAERQLIEQPRAGRRVVATGLGTARGGGRRFFAAGREQVVNLVDPRVQLGNFLVGKRLNLKMPYRKSTSKNSS